MSAQQSESSVDLPPLCWDRNSLEEERCQGYEDGARVAMEDIADRGEFLRILAAMDRGRLAFLTEMRRAHFIASTPAGKASLGYVEQLLFGAASGGIGGEYGQAFCSAIRDVGQFAKALH